MKCKLIGKAAYINGQTDGMNVYLVSGKPYGNKHVFAATSKDAIMKYKARLFHQQ